MQTFRKSLALVAVALLLTAMAFLAPSVGTRSLSHKIPTIAPPVAKSPAVSIDDFFPLLAERVNHPAHAFVGDFVSFFQWLFGISASRVPVERQHADGKTLVGIYPPEEYRSKLGPYVAAPLQLNQAATPAATRGPYDVDVSVRLIKGWKAKFQFQSLMLQRELHRADYYQNMVEQEEIEQEWKRTKRYMAWAKPDPTMLADLYNARFDFGGKLTAQAAINAITKSLTEWYVDWFFDQNFGEMIGERPFSDHPNRLAGVTLRITGHGLPPGTKISVYDLLTGQPTPVLASGQLDFNGKTAVNVCSGQPVAIVVDTSTDVTAVPFPNERAADGIWWYTNIPTDAREFSVTLMPAAPAKTITEPNRAHHPEKSRGGPGREK